MNILEQIIEVKKAEVLELQRDEAKKRFVDSEIYAKKCNDFRSAISLPNKLSLIAEVKKGSPSKGIIRNDFNHIEIADIYNHCNINAISVLTDKKFFFGDISYLEEISKTTNVPLLRKDFIIDEIQIHQAKAFGADAVLLICEILKKEKISEFTEIAYSLGLSVLLELHSEDQLSKINFDRNKIIGINNRNLKSFHTSLDTTENIKGLLPHNIITVSESGISTKEDIIRMKNLGINAVLVGEFFMRSENIKESVNSFMENC
ncbi:MAG: indole-3-glycerol phosphate synthase TrpC [Ignavibacteria bacterium]|nr:indole-3-glycerol phosphate synthase TrpC [Ignavibacteria bacterium]